MGLLPTMSDAVRARPEPPGPPGTEAAGASLITSLYCRRCAAWVDLATTRTLSTHRTSEAIVTYFRCPEGHADLYQTSAAPPWSAHGNTAKT